MQTIALPKKVKYQEGKEKFQGKIIIEPCFPGYGIRSMDILPVFSSICLLVSH